MIKVWPDRDFTFQSISPHRWSQWDHEPQEEAAEKPSHRITAIIEHCWVKTRV